MIENGCSSDLSQSGDIPMLLSPPDVTDHFFTERLAISRR